MLRIENYSYKHRMADNYALKDVNIHLEKGQALLLTGRSGSGKSTLLSAISGLIPHYYKGESQGRIIVDGIEPKDVDLNMIGEHVGLMLQNAEVQFLAPTVSEEIFLSLRCRNISEERSVILTEQQLKRFRIEHIRDSSVLDLSEGQKQKVILASLTALKPKLILLDEPTANLDPASVAELKELLSELKSEGVSLVIADHRLSWLNGLCERIAVISNGSLCWEGGFEELQAGDKYMELGLRSPVEQKERDIEILDMCECGVQAKNLTFSYNSEVEIFKNLCCAIPYGKVTVLSGPNGAGKTTLAKVLSGLIAPQEGQISFDGSDVSRKDLPAHTGVVLQNSDHQLYMSSVLSEVSLAINMCPRSSTDEAREVLRGFDLGGLESRHPQSLSGGEKQRLVVAVGVSSPPKLLILDEPTSGLDGHNLRLMNAHIRRIADSGAAVLVITHDVELINICADYKVTMAAGKPVCHA